MNEGYTEIKSQVTPVADDENIKPLKTITVAVYALQAVSFLLGVTYFVAVIINYIKRDDVRGTWLESHFRWQIRTFWFSALWGVIGLVTSFIVIGYILLMANGIWIIYRVAKGWMYLNDKREMYITDPQEDSTRIEPNL